MSCWGEIYKAEAILLFKNAEELYSDHFYPKGSEDYCLYTGIGHQDSPKNRSLNIAVMYYKNSKIVETLISYAVKVLWSCDGLDSL